MSDNALSPPPLPARPLARASSRRSLRSLSSNNDDPLSSPSSPTRAGEGPLSNSESSNTGGGGQYAVYSGAKKRTSANPLSLSDSIHPSSPPAPPFHPAISLAPPPLVSRPSNSTLPSPSGRTYARSVSEAKEQLQKQALKAELQSLGLQNDSWGAAIITKLAGIPDDGELSSIAEVVKSGKATVLLPSEKLEFPSTISTSNLLDHLILLSSASSTTNEGNARSFVSLSGLRGILTDEGIIYGSVGLAARATDHGVLRQSTLEPVVDYNSEELHRYLRGSASSSASPSSYQSPTAFPKIEVSSAVSTLSLPRHASPTPSAVAAASRTNTSSRLAALFSKSSASPTTPPPDLPSPLTGPSADSTASPLASKSLPNLELSVIVVASPVRFQDISKHISSTINADLKTSLEQVQGIKGDTTAADRIINFSTRFQPPTSSNWTSVFPPASSSTTYPISPSLFEADLDTISEGFQDLLHSTRLDLSRNLSIASPMAPPTTMDESGGLEDFGDLEERVDSTLSEIEDLLLTKSLYPHVFSPPFSSDAQDDENLASRIAALNVLELGLEHLGVDLGSEDEGLPGWEGQKRSARETVEDLADMVGKELARLEDPSDRTASSKLDVFVQVHKVLVDELGKLPAIPLKKEVDPSTAATVDHSHEVEMDDASSRSSSRAPSRPRSPTPMADIAEQTDDELLKTPRPPPAEDQDVPEIKLPDPSAPAPESDSNNELSSSMHEATSSSMFEPTIPAHSPPTSIFDSSARARSTSVSSSLHSYATSPSTSTSGADLILPLLIYSVVRSNPPRLISHVRFAHRFRSEALMRGQASYCLTNFDAVIEFLNHVDVSSLGLSSQKVFAATNPSPSFQSSSTSTSTRPRAYTTGRLSSRLTAEMPAALSAVADSSYRMLFGPKGLSAIASGVGGAAPRSLEEVKGVLEGARGRARMGLPFRRSASVATLPTEAKQTRGREGVVTSLALNGGGADETGQHKEMVDLPGGTPDVPASDYTPPSSPRPITSKPAPVTDTLSPDSSPSKTREDDQRSIRSISSMIRDTTIGRTLGEMSSTTLSAASGSTQGEAGAGDRPSFRETLSGFTGLGRFGGAAQSEAKGSSATGSTRASIFSAFGPASTTSPTSSRRPTLLNPMSPPSSNQLIPNPSANSSSTSLSSMSFKPVRKFLEVNSVDELKMGEVRLLLESYRELVAVLESEKEARLMAEAGIGALKE